VFLRKQNNEKTSDGCNRFNMSNEFKVSKDIYKIAAVVLTMLNILCLTLLYNQIIITNEYSKTIEDYKNEINRITELQEKQIEEKCIEYYEQHLTKVLDEYDLNFLAQKQWNYALSLNGKVVDKSIIYINEDYVHLILAEVMEDKEVLPQAILKKGTISGADPYDMLQDHLSISTNIEYSMRVEEEDCNRRVIYDFRKIPKGTIIYLNLSFLLSERLQIGEGPQWESKIQIIRR
jgi:hypothetical protein